MSQMNGIPSVSTLVVCLTEVRDRLPEEFDEQISLLKSVARYLEVYLRKPGAEILASALEQIITHLELLPGAEVEITLEIRAQVPDGIPENVIRTVTENSRTLKFEASEFED